MFKNSLDLRLHIETLVYNYLKGNAHEVASYQLGLSSYAGDPVYVTKTEVVVSEDQDPAFRKYAGFEKIVDNRSLIDGYVFYTRKTSGSCLVGNAIDYYWQKEGVKNFKNAQEQKNI